MSDHNRGRYCTTRLMEPDDITAVMSIERSCHAYPWSEGIMRDCLKAGYHCLVAEEQHELVGFGVMLFGVGEAHLLNLCVAPKAQGNGFARYILADLVDVARRKSLNEMYLEVRPSNTVAIALYDAFGFNEVGRRPDYYDAADGREDALILALVL